MQTYTKVTFSLDVSPPAMLQVGCTTNSKCNINHKGASMGKLLNDLFIFESVKT
jgi:hypothetical protein